MGPSNLAEYLSNILHLHIQTPPKTNLQGILINYDKNNTLKVSQGGYILKIV